MSELTDDQLSVGGDPAGRPVGHGGARVEISESTAWTVGGGLALIVLIAVFAGAIALIVNAALNDRPLLGVAGQSGERLRYSCGAST